MNHQVNFQMVKFRGRDHTNDEAKYPAEYNPMLSAFLNMIFL